MDASNNTGMVKSPSNPNEYIHDLCNRFYALVDRLETMEEKHKVTMDFTSCLHKLSLGEVVDINDGLYDKYVITRMYGTFSYTESSDGSGAAETCFHKAEGIPVLSNSPDANGTISVPILDALSRIVVPPSCVSDSITNSNDDSSVLLEAEVIDNADPRRMNRVRVKYSFDNKQTESPWIPVLVPFSGSKANGGFTMTLEKKEHVLVEVKNKAATYVVGSYYHGDNSNEGNVYNHPDLGYKDNIPATYKVGRKIRSIVSGNGHALTFKDNPDNNIVFSKIPIVNSVFSSLRLNDKETGMSKTGFGKIKGGGIVLSDGSCLCTLSLDADKQAININSDFGTVGISAFTGITVNAPNGDITIKGKNVSIEAGNNLSLKAGTNIRKKDSCQKSLGLGIGTAFAGMGTSSLSSLCGVDLSKIFDVSYLRNIYEIFMRPVEGTLSIQSNRNIQMTAGAGKVTVPSNLLSDRKFMYNGKWKEFSSDYSVSNYCAYLGSVINKCLFEVTSFVKHVSDLRKTIISQRTTLVESFKFNVHPDRWKADVNKLESLLFNEGKRVPQDLGELVKENPKNEKVITDWYTDYSDQYKQYLETRNQYRSDILKFNSLNEKLKNVNDKDYSLTGLDIRFTLGAVSDDSTDEAFLALRDDIETSALPRLKRAVVVKILSLDNSVKVLKLPDENVQDRHLGKPDDYEKESYQYVKEKSESLKPYIQPKDGYLWDELCDALQLVVDAKGSIARFADGVKTNPFVGGLLSGFTDALGVGNYDQATGRWKPVPSITKAFNIGGAAGPRAYEEMSAFKGNILISNTSGTSLGLNNDNSGWTSHPNLEDGSCLSKFIKDLKL